MAQDELEIGDFNIDPLAEEKPKGNSSVTARQEETFFKQAGEQFRLAHNQQNLGLLGKLFGSNSTAPTNIAGFVILVSLLMISCSYLIPPNPELSDFRKLLLGLVSSALSFIFGAASKK